MSQGNNYKVEVNGDKYKNPKIIGPGIWHCIRAMAIKAVSSRRKGEFARFANLICDTFPCDTCKSHFRKFINDNPIEERFSDENLLSWYHDLLNSVNRRLGKREYTYEETLYFGESNRQQGRLAYPISGGSSRIDEIRKIKQDKQRHMVMKHRRSKNKELKFKERNSSDDQRKERSWRKERNENDLLSSSGSSFHEEESICYECDSQNKNKKRDNPIVKYMKR